jgi:hypothetical protein
MYGVEHGLVLELLPWNTRGKGLEGLLMKSCFCAWQQSKNMKVLTPKDIHVIHTKAIKRVAHLALACFGIKTTNFYTCKSS